jgi:hypothetical protein
MEDREKEFLGNLKKAFLALTTLGIFIGTMGSAGAVPDIQVAPETVFENLLQGETGAQNVTVSNNGDLDLTFNACTISPNRKTDIDLDGSPEIIVRAAGEVTNKNGYTYVVNYSNLDQPSGWEWRSPYGGVRKGLAIADVNSDGIPNLLEGGAYGMNVYNVKDDEVLYAGLNSRYSYGGTAAGDIDQDGTVEMLVADMYGYIYVYDGRTGEEDDRGHIITTRYATRDASGLGIGDIDNDGVVEVVRSDRYGIDIFDGETRQLEGEISISINYWPDLVLGDADGDGIAEIYTGAGHVWAYTWDGSASTQVWRSPSMSPYARPCGFGDVDRDGTFEVYVGNSAGKLYALNASSGQIRGSVYTGSASYTSCALGDVDKDGTEEIVAGSRDGYIRVYSYESGTFTLEKKSVTSYGKNLGDMADTMIISGADDPRSLLDEEIDWLSASPTDGIVPFGDSANVTISIDATGLANGTYNGEVIFNTNDPDNESVAVPVTLNVLVIPTPGTIDIDPDTLNLKSKGQWITSYIELPMHDVSEIYVSSVALTTQSGATIPVDMSGPYTVGDYDSDGEADLMVKFSRATVVEALSGAEYETIYVWGSLVDNGKFEGTDTIRLIQKVK